MQTVLTATAGMMADDIGRSSGKNRRIGQLGDKQRGKAAIVARFHHPGEMGAHRCLQRFIIAVFPGDQRHPAANHRKRRQGGDERSKDRLVQQGKSRPECYVTQPHHRTGPDHPCPDERDEAAKGKLPAMPAAHSGNHRCEMAVPLRRKTCFKIRSLDKN